MRRIALYLSLVRFRHSVFALPFVLMGAWLAADGPPGGRTLGWIVVAAVAARSAAMGFNRLVDRELDARNPRTAAREIPSGRIDPRSVVLLVALSAAVFVWAALRLNPLAGALSAPVLVVLLGYSYVKRFHFLAHAVLGLALALAPLGAWIAVRGDFEGRLAPILALAVAAWSWVAGFDLIYATQDVEFDRAEGLHSVPAVFGLSASLRLSAVLHVLTVAALLAVGASAGLGWVWGASVTVAALLLAFEHRLVRPDDLSRVDTAFFTVNGWIGVALFVGLALDMGIAAGGAA